MSARSLRWLVLVSVLAAVAVLRLRAPVSSPPGPPSVESGFRAVCTRVHDGDTLTVSWAGSTERIRLFGIDAPERTQPFSNRSRSFLAATVEGREVLVEPVTRDRYDRLVARVGVEGRDLGERMLEAGWAWHYVRYDDSARYRSLEEEARTAKRGLWQEARPTPPWEFRRAAREAEP